MLKLNNEVWAIIESALLYWKSVSPEYEHDELKILRKIITSGEYSVNELSGTCEIRYRSDRELIKSWSTWLVNRMNVTISEL